MSFAELIADHAGPFALTTARLSGLLLFGPLLAVATVPVRVRALLLFMLTLSVYPTLDPSQMEPVELDLAALGWAMACEMLIGLSIGAVAAVPIAAMEVAGKLIGQQAGLGLATVFNPAVDTESGLLSQLLLYTAILIFLAIGGLEAMFLAVANTFSAVPLGAATPAHAPLDLYVGVLASGFEMAMRVAIPVLCIIFLETLAMGFIMKTMPQLNILSVGFPIKIIAGLMAMIFTITAVNEVAWEEISAAARALLLWSRSPG